MKFVYSAVNDAKVLHELMLREGVTHSAGVPTVWLAMFQHLDATGANLGKLHTAIIGGSAAPRAMIERLMGQGIPRRPCLGMTETSPIGTVGAPTPDWDDLSFEQQVDIVCKQGRVLFGVELQTVSLDDDNVVLPRDGKSSGKLRVRGPWVLKRYFKGEADAVDANQWFDTGDVAMLHPDGTLQLTDRTKDVIKSGGEWISSANWKCGHGLPGVAEAGAIGVYHPKWDERPVLVVVKKPELTSAKSRSRPSCLTRLPNGDAGCVIFDEELPHTGTGKIQKTALRERYKDLKLA